MKCSYFQCSNSDCHFRFPSNLPRLDSHKCPMCGSSLSISAFVELEEEVNTSPNYLFNMHIECLFDNIRSAWNVGSMIRTADGFGVKHLYFCGITPTPENKRVYKTSLGAEKFIKWTHLNNSVDKIESLKENNYIVVVLEGHEKALDIYHVKDLPLHYPLVLVVGNEVCGVDPEIIKMSDLILNIPMVGIKNSLNVAVAFGIAISSFNFHS